MKVLYVITKSERGGAQVHLLDLVRSLRDQEEVIVCCGDQGFLTDECAKLGVEVNIVPELVHPIRPLQDVRAVFRIASLIRKYRPDIVHGHTGKAGLVVRVAARLTGVPAIYTVHSWSFVSSSRATTLMAKCLERVMTLAGGVIVEVCHFNYRIASRRKLASPARHVTIWNGVADSSGRAAVTGHSPVRILMTARFAWPKDHASLLRALVGITEAWLLTLAGDGPAKDAMIALAESLGIADRVRFIGDTAEIEQLLISSDIFVLSSLSEGLPLSILEAMRAGLPVVASDVGGIPELVCDGVSGCLFPPGDIAALRTRLLCLLTSPEDRHRMGRLGRLRYERHFQLESMVGSTCALYRDYCIPAT